MKKNIFDTVIICRNNVKLHIWCLYTMTVHSTTIYICKWMNVITALHDITPCNRLRCCLMLLVTCLAFFLDLIVTTCNVIQYSLLNVVLHKGHFAIYKYITCLWRTGLHPEFHLIFKQADFHSCVSESRWCDRRSNRRIVKQHVNLTNPWAQNKTNNTTGANSSHTPRSSMAEGRVFRQKRALSL